jgi:hypothetical protein
VKKSACWLFSWDEEGWELSRFNESKPVIAVEGSKYDVDGDFVPVDVTLFKSDGTERDEVEEMKISEQSFIKQENLFVNPP